VSLIPQNAYIHFSKEKKMTLEVHFPCKISNDLSTGQSESPLYSLKLLANSSYRDIFLSPYSIVYRTMLEKNAYLKRILYIV
ncbi:hypothetical protein ACWPXU_13350, partial [Enterococcus faecalis]